VLLFWGKDYVESIKVIRCEFHQHFTNSFFVWKFFAQHFFYLQFGYVIFCQKNIGTKAAHIMLMKFAIDHNPWHTQFDLKVNNMPISKMSKQEGQKMISHFLVQFSLLSTLQRCRWSPAVGPATKHRSTSRLIKSGKKEMISLDILGGNSQNFLWRILKIIVTLGHKILILSSLKEVFVSDILKFLWIITT